MDRPGRAVRQAFALVALGALGCAGCGGSSGVTVPPASTAADTPSTTAALATSTTVTLATTTVTSASTTTDAPTTTSTTLPGGLHPVTPGSPLRVWVLGDSLAETVGAALVRAASEGDRLVVELDYVKGSGLVRSDLFDWPTGAAEGLVKRNPEVVVCLLGANDGQALRLPGGWLAFGAPEWDAEYTRRVGAFMDLLLGRATRIYWVGVPVMAEADYDRRVQHINELQELEASARTGVAYLDAYSLLLDEGGGFAWELPDDQGNLVEVRLPDGVHLTAAGAERVAGLVQEAIAGDWLVSEG